MSAAVREHNPRIIFSNARNQADGVRKIGRFRRHHKGRVHLDGHRQLPPRAVIDNSALRREIKTALLLMLRPPLKIAVTKNLQINQPQADRQQPETQKSRQSIEPESCAVRRVTCRHVQSSETSAAPGKESRRENCVVCRTCVKLPHEITATGAMLAITGAVSSAATSMRITCPGCGDCIPSLARHHINSLRIAQRRFFQTAAPGSSPPAHRAATAALQSCTHIQWRGNAAAHIP